MKEKLTGFFGKAADRARRASESLDKKYLYCIIAGLLVSAFFAIVAKMGGWCFVPVVFLSYGAGFLVLFRGGSYPWREALAAVVGSVPIVLFTLIG